MKLEFMVVVNNSKELPLAMKEMHDYLRRFGEKNISRTRHEIIFQKNKVIRFLSSILIERQVFGTNCPILAEGEWFLNGHHFLCGVKAS
jgi:hypothetical protein